MTIFLCNLNHIPELPELEQPSRQQRKGAMEEVAWTQTVSVSWQDRKLFSIGLKPITEPLVQFFLCFSSIIRSF